MREVKLKAMLKTIITTIWMIKIYAKLWVKYTESQTYLKQRNSSLHLKLIYWATSSYSQALKHQRKINLALRWDWRYKMIRGRRKQIVRLYHHKWSRHNKLTTLLRTPITIMNQSSPQLITNPKSINLTNGHRGSTNLSIKQKRRVNKKLITTINLKDLKTSQATWTWYKPSNQNRIILSENKRRYWGTGQSEKMAIGSLTEKNLLPAVINGNPKFIT
jgi:hypothetical protein